MGVPQPVRGCSMSKLPVPVEMKRPATTREDGDWRSSGLELRQAWERKCMHVSKVTFCSGDGLDAIAARLKPL